MGRIGFHWGEEENDKIKTTKEIIEITKLPGIDAQGIFTHFSDADNKEYTETQINKFKEAITYISNFGFTFKISHAAASVGSLNYPNSRFDMCRLGLALYGYSSPDTGNSESSLGLIPVMTVKSKVCAVRNLPKGSHISYGRSFTLPRDSIVAVLPIGYGDGFPRKLSNKANVKIKGKKCKILGRVCMDVVMADVTEIAKNEDIKEGDIAIIFDEELIEENIRETGMIVHEILTGISGRVERLYIKEGKVNH